MLAEWGAVPEPSSDPMAGGSPEAIKDYKRAQRLINAAKSTQSMLGRMGGSAPAAAQAGGEQTATPKGKRFFDGMREKLSAFAPAPATAYSRVRKGEMDAEAGQTGSPDWAANLQAATMGQDPTSQAIREQTIAQSLPQRGATPLDLRMAGEFAYNRSLVMNPNTPIQELSVAYAQLQKYGVEPPDDIKMLLFGTGQSMASLREGVRDPSMLGTGAIGQPQLHAAMANPASSAPPPPSMRSLKAKSGSRRASSFFDSIRRV